MNTTVRKIWRRRVAIPTLRRIRPQLDVRLEHRIFRVDLRDQVIGSLLYIDRSYERETERLIRTLDLTSGVLVDAGAHIGLHTVLMSELAGPAGKVFAFEPAPANFHLLHHNLERNGCGNVTAIAAAVGEKSGVCRLALHDSNFGDHRIAHAGRAGAAQAEVRLTTIDETLHEIPPGSVKLIKMDVQGYELRVLEGAAETLRRNPGVILIVEIFPEGLAAAGTSASELVGRLRHLGFSGWEFSESRLLPLQEPWTYDLIRNGQYADAVLSTNPEGLNRILAALYGPLPRAVSV